MDKCDCLSRMCIAHPDDVSEHHHKMCPGYRTEKHPRLFHYCEGFDAWVPASEKSIEDIVCPTGMADGDVTSADFMRQDMTDLEFDSLPSD